MKGFGGNKGFIQYPKGFQSGNGLLTGVKGLQLGTLLNLSGYNFAIEGHSFAADASLQSYANDTIDTTTTFTSAVGGSTMSLMSARAAILDSKIDKTKHNILLIWMGSNDIQEAGDGEIFYTAFKSYVQARIAAGWKIFNYTMTPVADSRAVMYEVERGIVNNYFRTDLANLSGVHILDTDTLSELDDPANQRYYAGEVHLSPLGYWLANNLFRASLGNTYADAVTAVEVSDDFVLTPTGTGTGISRLDIWSDEYSILTLDGNAKFYTDAAATLGECDMWAVSPAVTLSSPMYIKTTGGTSNLKIIRNKLSRITAWVSSTNALSLGGDVSQLAGIEELIVTGNNTLSGDVSGMTTLEILDVTGSNTLSGSVAALKLLTKLSVTGSNTLSGSVAALTLLTILNVTGSNTLSGSIAALTLLTQLTAHGSNTLSGSIAALISLTFVSVRGSNTITGSLNGLVSVTYFEVWGNNTLTGDISFITDGCTRIYVTNGNFNEYTAGAVWSNALVIISPAAGYGYSQLQISNILIDNNNSVGGSVSKTLTLTGSNASMSDTAQGGIWGDYSGTASPSALAIAYKNLIRVRLNTLTLVGITVPGVSGDGAGFPAGFGNWYRS